MKEAAAPPASSPHWSPFQSKSRHFTSSPKNAPNHAIGGTDESLNQPQHQQHNSQTTFKSPRWAPTCWLAKEASRTHELFRSPRAPWLPRKDPAISNLLSATRARNERDMMADWIVGAQAGSEQQQQRRRNAGSARDGRSPSPWEGGRSGRVTRGFSGLVFAFAAPAVSPGLLGEVAVASVRVKPAKEGFSQSVQLVQCSSFIQIFIQIFSGGYAFFSLWLCWDAKLAADCRPSWMKGFRRLLFIRCTVAHARIQLPCAFSCLKRLPCSVGPNSRQDLVLLWYHVKLPVCTTGTL